MFIPANPQSVADPASSSLKASIQDLAHLHQYYDPSDELLWAFFNTRVLLDQPIGVDEFVVQSMLSGDPYRQIPSVVVG